MQQIKNKRTVCPGFLIISMKTERFKADKRRGDPSIVALTIRTINRPNPNNATPTIRHPGETFHSSGF
jgi:hypothetical protein